MNRIVVFVALAVALILGVGALSAAQDATPEAGTGSGDLCASPVGEAEDVVVLGTPGVDRGASPEASPEATPELQFACASPAVGTPVTAGEAAIEASPV